MIIIMIATACVAVGIGVGVVFSKKRFNDNISDADSQSTSSVAQDESLSDEINRYEQLKVNLVAVKKILTVLIFQRQKILPLGMMQNLH